jgi:hypothetical protein
MGYNDPGVPPVHAWDAAAPRISSSTSTPAAGVELSTFRTRPYG